MQYAPSDITDGAYAQMVQWVLLLGGKKSNSRPRRPAERGQVVSYHQEGP